MEIHPFTQVPEEGHQLCLPDPILTESFAFEAVWYKRDFGSTLEHHLNTPVPRTWPDPSSAQGDEGYPAPATIGYLLLSNRPAVESLRAVKHFAKRMRAGAQTDRLRQVATVLYYASIAAAELRANSVITTLPRPAILDGYRWAWGRSWTYFPLCCLFESAIALQDHCATRCATPDPEPPELIR
jgi:hypothetical protein